MATHFGRPACLYLLAVVLTAAAALGIADAASPSEPPIADRKEGEEKEIERRREWFFSTRRAGAESEKDLARLRQAGVDRAERTAAGRPVSH